MLPIIWEKQKRVYNSFMGEPRTGYQVYYPESPRINSNYPGVRREMGMKKATMKHDFKLRNSN